MKVTAQWCLNSCILSAVLCISVKECFCLRNRTCHHHLSMKHCSSYVRYKTLTVVTVMITVLCNVMLHSLVRVYPLYKCWCTHIEVHFHGVLWADLTEVLTALLLTAQVSWHVTICHWVSGSPVFWWFVLTLCSWSSNFIGLLDCSPRDIVSHPRKLVSFTWHLDIHF